MELGIDMFGDLRINEKTGYTQSPQQRLQEILEEIKLMDELGLDFFGIGEHHRADYSVSSPEILLAAAAAITKNIKLGSSVSVISSSDPVKLFEDFSMVDNLSNGRAEIMAGRGSFIESFPLFGYDLNDYEELFEEKLDLLLTLNKNEIINWDGKFRAAIKNQTIYPRPVQKELPIWIAVGGTPASVVRAANLGLPIIFAIIGGDPKNFLPLFDYYKQKYESYGHDPKNMQIGVHMHAFLNETNQFDDYFPLYAAQTDRVGRSRNWPAYTRQQFEMGRASNGHLIIGDANLAIDKILKYKELFGLTRFSAHMDMGAPTHLDMMKSIEIYGTKVAPEIRKV